MQFPTFVNQIDDALRAHNGMRRTLELASSMNDTGKSAADVGDDHKCAFGRWLHGHEIDPATRAGKPYQVVNRLHHEFHRAAFRVVAAAERGDRTGAERLLNAEFSAKSDTLMRALNKWRGEATR